MERLCQHCGLPFVPKRSDAAFCGRSCKQQAYFLRKIGSGIQNNNDISDNSDSLIEMTDNTDNQEVSLSVTNNQSKPVNKTEKPQVEKEVVPLKDKKGGEYSSSFLDFIGQRIRLRDYETFLYAFEIEYPALSYWINTRYLCLIESLLVLSEMKSIDLDDLKDISNAFQMLLRSEIFKNMPVAYPYENEMNKYFETIKMFCMNSEEEIVELRFTRKTKAELLATRFELTQLVPRIGFNQLNFSE